MTRKITVGFAQSSFGGPRAENLTRAETLIKQAATDGINLLLLPELFEHPYFCKTQLPENLQHAEPITENLAVTRLQKLAAETSMVLPVSFYERSGQVRFNTVAIIDADGQILGAYRKTHIPDGPGYQEKYYFTPGDSGFQVWDTRHGKIGVGICWDQWYPEAARAMALQGAEILLYPTAIGSEPHLPGYDSSSHWRTVMCGHAAANLLPLIAANRVGHEHQPDAHGNPIHTHFYGHSFIADPQGAIIAEAHDTDGLIKSHTFDLDQLARHRAEWGLFRDRRPEHYRRLTAH